jgi:hypothetical protein
VKLGRQRRRVATPILDLIEEAIALLRRAPASVHLTYYLGAVPFWVGMLYFLSDMARNAYAESHVLDAALGMAALYVWKKAWQAVSAAQLRGVVTGRPDESWSSGRIWRMAAAQAAIQPWGLILRPLAGMLTVPVVWVSAFFQNVTVLGDGTEHRESVVSRATAQALLWPGQAHGVVGIITMFTLFVWVNIAIALAAGPHLLKMFFGIETAYTRDTLAYFNTTYFTATVALTSLAVDPLRKAIFTLRCFSGDALHTGEDLVADLRHFQKRNAGHFSAIAALYMLLLSPPTCPAAEAPVEKIPAPAKAEQLQERINEVLERREYAWRAPRAQERDQSKKSWMARWFEGLGKKFESTVDAAFKQAGRFLRWLRGLFTIPTGTGAAGIDWFGLAKAIAVLIGIAALAVIVWLVARMFARKQKRPLTATAVVATPPDLRSENLVADQLPEDGWRQLAREYAARGELVLALRAAWLAGLAHLGHRELIGIARYKSNREYDRELRRRARDRSHLLSAFDENLRAFERSWYGKHEVSKPSYDEFEQNLDRIRTS